MNESEGRVDWQSKNQIKNALSCKSKSDMSISGIPSEMQEGLQDDFPVLPRAGEL